MTTDNETPIKINGIDQEDLFAKEWTDGLNKAIEDHIDQINEQVNYVNQLITEQPAVHKSCLTIGTKYVTHSGNLVDIVHEVKNRYLGLVESQLSLPFTIWYTADGYVDRDFDEVVEQDPFDIKKVHRDADVVYLLRNNAKYTSNNCFMSYDTAAEAALARGGRVVPFREVMED